MEEKKETFTYTYSAKEQEEIKKIRDKYAPPRKEETPMEQLRRLDESATRGATVVSLIVGIDPGRGDVLYDASRLGAIFHSGHCDRRCRDRRRGCGLSDLQLYDQTQAGTVGAGDHAVVGRTDEVKENSMPE